MPILIAVFLLLAGCSGQMEPAQRSISDVEAALAAVSQPAAQYAPNELRDVRAGLDRLIAAFNHQDYQAVVAGAPAVLSAAHGVGELAAARRAELTQALERRWAALAAVLPERLEEIDHRLDKLGTRAAKKAAAGIDPDAWRTRLSRQASLWSKAQAAFATGNLTEAVKSAEAVEASLAELTVSLDGRVAAH